MTDTIPNEPAGICIRCGPYLLKLSEGVIWLENAEGEGMQVKPEDFSALLDTLFKEKF